MRPWRGSYRKWTTRYSDGGSEDAGLRAASDGHAVCRPLAIGRSSSGTERVARRLKQIKHFGGSLCS